MFSNKAKRFIQKTDYYLEAEQNIDENVALVKKCRRVDIKRKEKRNQIRERNRTSYNEIHSSPEYETLPMNYNHRYGGSESDYDGTTLRLKMKPTKLQRNHHHQTSTSANSFDDSKYQSCISLDSNISVTPKSSRTLNFFESNLSNICRISDYRGACQNLLSTPEIQKACSSDGSTVNFWKNTVQALGICFLVWNCIRNMIMHSL